MGRSVVEGCWRKVGICRVVGEWESIRMEVSKGCLFL